mgnify:CR=1 FL=1
MADNPAPQGDKEDPGFTQAGATDLGPPPSGNRVERPSTGKLAKLWQVGQGHVPLPFEKGAAHLCCGVVAQGQGNQAGGDYLCWNARKSALLK